MNPLPPETKALRRLVYVGFASFFIGFFGALAVLEWLMLRYIEPDTRWWEILHFAVNAILMACVVGLAFTTAAVCLPDWLHRLWNPKVRRGY
jgi:hypothetical protein